MKESFVDRLLKFIEDHGGVYEVAESIDISPQTFYTMKRRGSLPNLSMIYALKERYSNLDIDWLLFGSREEKLNPQVADLTEKLRRSEAIIDSLTGISKKAKGAAICPGVDRRLRRNAAHQVMKLAHRPSRRFVFTPGRVQESKYAPLVSAYLQRVRMQ